MKKDDKRIKIINELKNKTGLSPDINYKDFPINNKIITLIYSNSVSSSLFINDFILRRLDEEKDNIKDKDLYNYIKNYIPNNSMAEINNIKDILYYLFSGFTIILFEDGSAIAFENKSKIHSDVSRSENEKSLKGPSDSFTENYEINTGMLRRRIKSENLWLKEATVGSESKTKIGLFYINGICNENLVNKVYKKIKKINIKYVGSTSYVLDAISNTNRSIFPTTLTTERADYACELLMEGRIVLMCENSNEVIILPCLFLDFFKDPDDYYEKDLNVIASRIVRIFAMLIALLTPALYISLMAYNIEAIPSKLLVNFTVQRDGVPFSTIFEVLAMSFMFQILRESDMRYPGKGGSSISIVGGLVLGQAAVEAGIVSPITIIIVGISSVASLAFSSIEVINSIRWWQLILIVLAAIFGFTGTMFGLLIIIAMLVKNSSLNKAYSYPFEPFNKEAQKDAIISKKDRKLNPKNIFTKEDK
ncbi:MAG: spore germination protein [Bacilli bacterium]|nr:spore germination protein [Bacilli bacterium]